MTLPRWKMLAATITGAGLLGLLLGSGAAAADEGIFMRADADGSIQLSNIPQGEDFQLLLAPPPSPVVAAVAPAEPHRDVPAAVAQYRDVVDQAARRSKVDSRLLHAVIAVESGYNAAAVSARGAVGLMQLMPETARRYGVRDSRNPGQNVRGGAQYLADLLKMFDNDVHLALAAYNAGEKAVLRYGGHIPPYRETTAYVPRVLAVYRRLKTLSI